jgi:L-lactate dehydrogenase
MTFSDFIFQRRLCTVFHRSTAAILRNQHGVLTVSSVLEGEYGISGDSLGVPCIVSRNGVEKILQVALPPDEQSALVKSAAVLREAAEELELPARS